MPIPAKKLKDPTPEKINRLALLSNNYLYYTRVYLKVFGSPARNRMLYWDNELQAFLDEHCEDEGEVLKTNLERNLNDNN